MATSTLPRPPADPGQLPSQLPDLHGALPRWACAAVLSVAALVSVLLFSVVGFNWFGFAILTAVLYLIGIYTVSRRVEGGRKATDRLVTGVVTSAFAIAMLPLVSLVITVLTNGNERFDTELFTETMRNVTDAGGGIRHAIIGTLIITGLATAISVPIGLLSAIYLVEYGKGRLARAITFLVDVMTGIPSIVAGLFAYGLFVLFFGPGIRSGIGGAVALSVLMIPIVVRAAEEMLKLVPNELREAAYALGVPKWRTIVKVVLPTAVAGIATGVTLAVARVIGETAPLLVIVGITDSTNSDPVEGRMATLPVFIYYSYTQPGVPRSEGIDRAWSAALVLIIIVMSLNIAARVIAAKFAPKSGR